MFSTIKTLRPLQSGGRFKAVGVLASAIFLTLVARQSEAEPAARFNFASFCNAVESKVLSNRFTHDSVLYAYQDMLVEASGVARQDSTETANRKIGVFLNANAASLTCNMTNFNPRNGNIYKLAVARQVDGFIDDALDNWRVNLNQIDATDNKTVLDYIRDRQDTAGPTYARTLGRYYDRFRAAGAKHRIELEQAGLAPSLASVQGTALAKLEGAALAGDVPAALQLYNAFAYGKDVNLAVGVDQAKARAWLDLGERSALAKSDPNGMVGIGLTYDAAEIGDAAQSAKWLARAVKLGSPEANYWLGRYYATGHGVPRDLDQALDLMKVAEAADVTTSALWMGSIHGWLGHRDEQVRWYRYAIASGLNNYPVPGFNSAGKPPLTGHVDYWFQVNGLDVCGPNIKGGRYC